ncbi:hypothetical protein CR513_22170, partial [Mucuna pruriens]
MFTPETTRPALRCTPLSKGGGANGERIERAIIFSCADGVSKEKTSAADQEPYGAGCAAGCGAGCGSPTEVVLREPPFSSPVASTVPGHGLS